MSFFSYKEKTANLRENMNFYNFEIKEITFSNRKKVYKANQENKKRSTLLRPKPLGMSL